MDTMAADDYTPDYDGVRIDELEVELSEIHRYLKTWELSRIKRAEEENKTYVYFDATEGEYLPIRGSAFFSTYLIRVRPLSAWLTLVPARTTTLVFRSAFYEVNGKTDY